MVGGHAAKMWVFRVCCYLYLICVCICTGVSTSLRYYEFWQVTDLANINHNKLYTGICFPKCVSLALYISLFLLAEIHSSSERHTRQQKLYTPSIIRNKKIYRRSKMEHCAVYKYYTIYLYICIEIPGTHVHIYWFLRESGKIMISARYKQYNFQTLFIISTFKTL